METFDGLKPNIRFDQKEYSLLVAAIDVYVAEIRKACLEDQGVANGEIGTLGFELQTEYAVLREKLTKMFV